MLRNLVSNIEKEGDSGTEEKGEAGGGFTIGGDISFYEWDYESSIPQKNPKE